MDKNRHGKHQGIHQQYDVFHRIKHRFDREIFYKERVCLEYDKQSERQRKGHVPPFSALNGQNDKQNEKADAAADLDDVGHVVFLQLIEIFYFHHIPRSAME